MLSLGVLAVLGARPLAAADHPMVALVKYLLSPFVAQEARLAEAEAFTDATKYCLVIANDSAEDWSFGCTDDLPRELKDPPSGSLTVASVRSVSRNGVVYWTPVTLRPGDRPVVIGKHFDTLVVTPVVAKTGYVTWQKFARVCYLQDQGGHRIYLTLTKDTPSSAVPVVGVAGISNRAVMDQKALQFSDKKRLNFNMIGIQVDRLRGD